MAYYANGLPRSIRPPVVPPTPPPPPPVIVQDDPYSFPQATYKPRNDSLPPVLPPHPVNWSGDAEARFDNESLLNDDSWAAQMVSPKPQRLPGGSTDAARKLEAAVTMPSLTTPAIRQVSDTLRPVSTYMPQGAYYPGGFVPPGPGSRRSPSPYTPGMPMSPQPPMRMPLPAPASPNIPPPRLVNSMSAGNLNAMTQQIHALSLERSRPVTAPAQHRRGASSTSSNAPLVAALPTPEGLQRSAPNEGSDPDIALSWIQSAILLSTLTPPSDLSAQSSNGGPTIGTILPLALSMLQKIAAGPSPPAVAYFLRGTLESSGAHPQFFERNPRAAFKDYEKAARAGYDAAWFRLGRDYESVDDLDRARDCFERGVKSNDRSCLYRMGMANLLGQLNLPSNPPVAFPLLIRSASLATLEVPQPPYVLGMILLNELPSISNLPLALLHTALPDPSVTLRQHALALIQRSAFLHFPPAQYKLGYAYENAQLGLPYDPTLSVRFYSCASQGGELEADMALSKWFLCGAEGYFDKDEGLARTFAEKAARRGLSSAEFAMGYYCEVGVGGPKNIEQARKWYGNAAKHNNPDAPARLAALSSAQPEGLSRTDHESLTNSTLIRSRTLARERSMSEGKTATGGRKKEEEALAAARRASLLRSYQTGLASVNEAEGISDNEDHRGSIATSLSSSSSVAAAIPPLAPSRTSSPGSSRPTTRQGRKVSPSPRPESIAMPSLGPASLPSTPNALPSQPSQPIPQSAPSNVVETIHGRGYSLSETILPGPAPLSTPNIPGTPGSAVPPKKGPATFEEMGFYSQPLDQQKCVIM